MKRGQPTFPSLFTFYSQFAALHRVSRDISVTGQAFGQRGRITFSTQRAVSWLVLPTSFRSVLAPCVARATGHTALLWRDRDLLHLSAKSRTNLPNRLARPDVPLDLTNHARSCSA